MEQDLWGRAVDPIGPQPSASVWTRTSASTALESDVQVCAVRAAERGAPAPQAPSTNSLVPAPVAALTGAARVSVGEKEDRSRAGAPAVRIVCPPGNNAAQPPRVSRRYQWRWLENASSPLLERSRITPHQVLKRSAVDVGRLKRLLWCSEPIALANCGLSRLPTHRYNYTSKKLGTKRNNAIPRPSRGPQKARGQLGSSRVGDATP